MVYDVFLIAIEILVSFQARPNALFKKSRESHTSLRDLQYQFQGFYHFWKRGNDCALQIHQKGRGVSTLTSLQTPLDQLEVFVQENEEGFVCLEHLEVDHGGELLIVMDEEVCLDEEVSSQLLVDSLWCEVILRQKKVLKLPENSLYIPKVHQSLMGIRWCGSQLGAGLKWSQIVLRERNKH